MQIEPVPNRTNRNRWFADVLAKYKRVAIVGGPKAGKTTLSRFVKDRQVVHTDDFRNYAWEDVPESVIKFVNEHSNTRGFVVEGTQVARALRKGLEVDAVVVLMEPLQTLSKGQASMAKAVMTVLADWFKKTQRRIPVLQAPPVAAGDENE